MRAVILRVQYTEFSGSKDTSPEPQERSKGLERLLFVLGALHVLDPGTEEEHTLKLVNVVIENVKVRTPRLACIDGHLACVLYLVKHVASLIDHCRLAIHGRGSIFGPPLLELARSAYLSGRPPPRLQLTWRGARG